MHVDFESARDAQSPDRRRVEGDDVALRDFSGVREHVALDVFGALLAIVPGLERDEDRRRIGLRGARDHVEAGDIEHVLDRGMRREDLLHHAADRLRALQCRALG